MIEYNIYTETYLVELPNNFRYENNNCDYDFLCVCRSLVALSLILAMLLFKPAPIYILDEVDAALDLSHTQNIGQMLRTHFTHSQVEEDGTHLSRSQQACGICSCISVL